MTIQLNTTVQGQNYTGRENNIRPMYKPPSNPYSDLIKDIAQTGLNTYAQIQQAKDEADISDFEIYSKKLTADLNNSLSLTSNQDEIYALEQQYYSNVDNYVNNFRGSGAVKSKMRDYNRKSKNNVKIDIEAKATDLKIKDTQLSIQNQTQSVIESGNIGLAEEWIESDTLKRYMTQDQRMAYRTEMLSNTMVNNIQNGIFKDAVSAGINPIESDQVIKEFTDGIMADSYMTMEAKDKMINKIPSVIKEANNTFMTNSNARMNGYINEFEAVKRNGFENDVDSLIQGISQDSSLTQQNRNSLYAYMTGNSEASTNQYMMANEKELNGILSEKLSTGVSAKDYTKMVHAIEFATANNPAEYVRLMDKLSRCEPSYGTSEYEMIQAMDMNINLDKMTDFNGNLIDISTDDGLKMALNVVSQTDIPYKSKEDLSKALRNKYVTANKVKDSKGSSESYTSEQKEVIRVNKSAVKNINLDIPKMRLKVLEGKLKAEIDEKTGEVKRNKKSEQLQDAIRQLNESIRLSEEIIAEMPESTFLSWGAVNELFIAKKGVGISAMEALELQNTELNRVKSTQTSKSTRVIENPISHSENYYGAFN